MKIRELHQVDCIELAINGAGEYFFPIPQFKDKKIDSIFIWDGETNMQNNNLFISIYSSEKKPLYVNCPAIEFNFDNVNNRICEVLDFDLLKIMYTGTRQFTLYVYFSQDEKMIDIESIYNRPIDVKNLHIDLENIISKEMAQGDKWVSLLSADNADYLRTRTVRMISCSIKYQFLFNIQLKNGNSLNKIPFFFFRQSPVTPYENVLPFVLADAIDIDLSSIKLLAYQQYTSPYIDLTFHYYNN